MPGLRNADSVISEFKIVHGDKYDYSLVKFVNMGTKIRIICPTHGVFAQSPKKHRVGQGCPKCSKYAGTFTNKSRAVHGMKYDYSQVVYKGANLPATIICPHHGRFEQVLRTHLSGKGCPACGLESRRRSPVDFLNAVRATHGDRYDLSQTVYTTCRSKVLVMCRDHGPFRIRPAHLESGLGCPICSHADRCMHNHNNPEDTGSFYIAEVTYNGRSCIKVGYTSKPFDVRFAPGSQAGVVVVPLIVLKMPLRDAASLEKQILITLKGRRAKWITRRFSGFTECFDATLSDIHYSLT